MGIQSYREADIHSLAPEKLLVLLYEKMVHDLLEARQAMAAGDRVTLNDRLNHSQQIIAELHSALDHSVGGEIPANLENLYEYLFAEHLAARVDQDPRHVDNCLAVIKPLLEAWRQVPPGSAREAARTRERDQLANPGDVAGDDPPAPESSDHKSTLFSVSA
jgi:flagellar protein FliS